MDFLAKLEAAIAKNNSLLCIGLDPDESKVPDGQSYLGFCKNIVDQTADLVCAYKPNSAFFEAHGSEGVDQLMQVCGYIRQKSPALPIIIDAKRGDIGSTNEQYARFIFDYLGADALTVQPYAGREAVQAFLDRADKGVIVLCRMSNPGAGEFQDLETNGNPLYMQVAQNVSASWNTNGNCLLVVGATNPAEMADIRQAVGDDMYFLVPGIGAQGGDIKSAIEAGGEKLIINSARDIIYNDNPRQRANKVRDEINKYRSNQ
jgi:orotidine-5'-phosphate decarboxylase